MKIVIVGLGLIGGSIAKALKKNKDTVVLGMDTSNGALAAAIADKAIDRKAALSDLGSADVVYLCVYPDAAVEFVRANAKSFGAHTIITDTCGVKRMICKEMEELCKAHGLSFVAGHPMAGKEKSGYAASEAEMFAGASYIIAQEEKSAETEVVEKLALEMGFGQVVYTSPEQHDRVIAFTSQLPHALACAYIMSPYSQQHQGFSAGSYRDVSRVADINAELWTRLFLENTDDLSDEIEALIKNLEVVKEAVSNKDSERLHDFLAKAAEIKRNDGTSNGASSGTTAG